jgi:hypothetical protein
MSAMALIPTLYRIVKHEIPEATDFTSPMMLGKRPQKRERSHPGECAGLSMFDSKERARSIARQFPLVGEWSAAVNLNPSLVAVWKTFGPGHYTV